MDDKFKDESCNMVLTKKQQKYQHYHLEKLVKNYYLLIKDIQ